MQSRTWLAKSELANGCLINISTLLVISLDSRLCAKPDANINGVSEKRTPKKRPVTNYAELRSSVRGMPSLCSLEFTLICSKQNCEPIKEPAKDYIVWCRHFLPFTLLTYRYYSREQYFQKPLKILKSGASSLHLLSILNRRAETQGDDNAFLIFQATPLLDVTLSRYKTSCDYSTPPF